MRFKRVDSARLLVAAKPDSNTDEGSGSLLALLLHLLELAGNMRKVLGYFSSLALDSNFPCIHGCRNCGKEQMVRNASNCHFGRVKNVPPAGISTQSSFNICLILLISSLLNNNNTPLACQKPRPVAS